LLFLVLVPFSVSLNSKRYEIAVIFEIGGQINKRKAPLTDFHHYAYIN